MKSPNLLFSVVGLLLLVPAAFGLSSNDTASLQSAIAALKAQGVVSTPEILERLTQQPVTGTRTNVFLRPAPAVEPTRARYLSLLAKYGLSATSSTNELRQLLQAAEDAAQAADDRPRVAEVFIDKHKIESLQRALAPDAPTVITNIVIEPVYGRPLWTGPVIRGEDIEGVQR